MSSANLPSELVEEILVRLPVKSLLRFRYVSKSWRDLIDSPDFTKSYLSKNSKSEYNILFGFQEDYTGNNEDYYENNYVVKDLEFGEVDLINWSNPVFDSVPCPDGVIFESVEFPFSFPVKIVCLGSCNGLIAFGNPCSNWNDIILVNPSTREYHLLPPIDEKVGIVGQNFGLGYDCFTDEYKLVLMPFQDDPEKGSEVHIYGSKSQTWRQIHFPSNYLTDMSTDRCGKYSHGALHWIVSPPEISFSHGLTRLHIAAFDLVTEKFMVAEYDGEQFGCPSVVNLEVLGGCICLCCRYPASGFSKMEVWMMKEYGVKESWCKLVSFDGNVAPLALSVCGRGLLFGRYAPWDCGFNKNSRCHLFWYNLDEETKECCGSSMYYPLLSCQQSLVRLPGKLS